MQTGKVKRFNRIKGYGFITSDAEGEQDKEIFVHFSEVESTGYKELVENQRVSYKLQTGERGEFATAVAVIEK